MSGRRRPSHDALIRDAGPYKVVSLSGGTLTIAPKYAGVPMAEGCTRPTDAEGWPAPCPACSATHIYGFLGRMALAARIERVLNSYTKEPPR